MRNFVFVVNSAAAIGAIFLALPAYARNTPPADFKISIPSTWKKAKLSVDGAVYVNTRARNEQIVFVQKVDVTNDNRAAFDRLWSEQRSIVESTRAKFLGAYGLVDYALISSRTRKATDPNFKSYIEAQSRYRGFRGQEIQMLERQFLANGWIYQVAYIEESAALNDRARIEAILDNFKPVYQKRRMPAGNEVFDGSGVVKKQEVWRELGGLPPSSGFRYPPDSIEAQRVCNNVPLEKRYSPDDPPLTEAGVLLACGAGAIEGFVQALKQASQPYATPVIQSPPGSAPVDRSLVRAEVGMVSHNLTIAVAQMTWHYVSRAVDVIGRYIQKEIDQYPCLKRKEQIGLVCAALALFVPPAGFVAKVAGGTALAARELTIVTSSIRAGIQGRRAEVPLKGMTSALEHGAEANLARVARERPPNLDEVFNIPAGAIPMRPSSGWNSVRPYDTEAVLARNMNRLSPSAKAAHETLTTQLGREYGTLVTDPGVTSRLDAFVAFAKTERARGRNLSPAQMREAFGESLGTRSFYRAMHLTDDQYRIVMNQGMASRFFDSHRITDGMEMVLREGVEPLRRIAGAHRGAETPFMSIGETWAVSSAGAFTRVPPGTKTYFFRVDARVIDTVEMASGESLYFGRIGASQILRVEQQAQSSAPTIMSSNLPWYERQW